MQKHFQTVGLPILNRGRLLATILVLLSVLGCNKLSDQLPWHHHGDDDHGTNNGNIKNEKGNLVYDWIDLQTRNILNSNPTIPNGVVIRAFAYTGIALYEAAQRGIPGNTSLSGRVYQMPDMPHPTGNNYSWTESANAALAASTRLFYPAMTTAQKASVDSLEAVYEARFRAIETQDVIDKSKAFGVSIANAVFDYASSDLFNVANAPYTPPVFPGAWEPTPPAFASAATPYAGNMRPFLHAHTTSVAGPPAFPYSETVGSDFYKMVRDIYDVSNNLTADQKNMALWWNDLGLYTGYTPPGHIMNIVSQVLRKENKDLITSIQCYTKTGMALWDGLIVVFRSKYKYNLVRPVTYIRKVIDPSWSSLIPTPPHPEYPAAHAFITSSAMAALASEIGNDHPFTDHTYEFLGWPVRSFANLNDVGIEAGNSRRFGGIHYAPSIAVGHELGKKVGEEIGAISFKK